MVNAFADKICRKLESRCFLQHFIFLIVLDRGGWRNTGKESWNFRTNSCYRKHICASFSPGTAQQLSHGCSAPPWVWKGYSQHCHPLRGDMGATSLTGTANFIRQFWLSGMEENETFRTQLGQVITGRFDSQGTLDLLSP